MQIAMNTKKQQKEYKADWALGEATPVDPTNENDPRNWITPDEEAKKASVMARLVFGVIGAFVIFAFAAAENDFSLVTISVVALIGFGFLFYFALKWFEFRGNRKKNEFFMKRGNRKYWGRGTDA